MRELVIRIPLVLLGVGALVVAGFSLSKLGHSSLDSPRWMYAAAGGAAIVAGLGLLWSAWRGLTRAPRDSERPSARPSSSRPR